MHRLVTALTATAAAAFAFAPSANATTSCDYQAPGILTVTMTERFDSALLAVGSGGGIQIRSHGPVIGCSGGVPTVTNTDNILVVDQSDDPSTPASQDGSTKVTIINPTNFSPGRTQEQGNDAFSEIEFILNLNDGSDDLQLSSTAGVDDLVLGNGGLNWNAGSGDPAPDADLISTPLHTISALLENGDDMFSAQGGQGTGDPYTRGHLQLNGEAGNDTLEGGNAPIGDSFSGGIGDDTLRGFGGQDQFFPTRGDDVVSGGSGGEDALIFDIAPAVTADLQSTGPQVTGQGTDTLSELEVVQGTEQADTLLGTAGGNGIYAGGGDDTLDGRGGDDSLDGGQNTDTVTYADAPGGVTADLNAGLTTGAAGTDRLFTVENLVGSAFADSLTGDAGPNAITAGAGLDIVRALAGADTVDVRDGGPDSASCGTELDTATADQQSVDAVDADCETTDFLPEAPAPAPAVDPGTPPADGATPVRDRSLSFSLKGAKSQRVLRTKFVLVKLRCPLEACTTVSKGAGKSVRKGLRAGSTKTLKLKLTARQLEAVRSALETRGRAKAKVTVRAVDAVGNAVTRSLTVRVTRR